MFLTSLEIIYGFFGESLEKALKLLFQWFTDNYMTSDVRQLSLFLNKGTSHIQNSNYD